MNSVSRQRDLILLITALALPTLVTWLYFIVMADRSAEVQQATYILGKTFQFGLPLLWFFLWRRTKTPAGETPRYPQSIAWGAAFGAAVFLAALIVHHYVLRPHEFYAASLALIQAKVQGFNLATPARYAVLAVFYCIVHAFLEEYYWRWFVYRQADSLMSRPAAIAVSSMGFMAHHVLVLADYFGWASPATYLFSLGVAIGGAFWAWLYERYGTLIGPWVSHLIIDAIIFAIGYDLLFRTG